MDLQGTSTTQSNRAHLLTAYVAIAYAISWAIEIPLALKAQGLLSAEIPSSIHYFASFGPFVAAIVLTWRENRLPGMKNLLGKTLKWRVEPI